MRSASDLIRFLYHKIKTRTTSFLKLLKELPIRRLKGDPYMVVNNHHIQNVLQAYGRQLNRSCNKSQVKQDEQLEKNDRISISAEAKKKQIFSKTASELIDRVVSNPASQEKELLGNNEIPSKGGTGRIGITFKEVDGQEGETMRHIDSENSDYLRSLFDTSANTLA